MPALQRSVSLRGARFWRQGGALMFVLHIDGSTRVGPREATAQDMDAYAEAFEAFEAGDEGGAMGPMVSFVDAAKPIPLDGGRVGIGAKPREAETADSPREPTGRRTPASPALSPPRGREEAK